MQLITGGEFLFLAKSKPEEALEKIYASYYSHLCNQVYLIIHDENTAEDIVQDVFFEVWKKKDTININQSLVGYLKRACRNRTLNHIRDNKSRWEGDSQLVEIYDSSYSTVELMSAEELDLSIQRIIEELPERCGIIFALSRYEEMSYIEIASELDISIKTVENQISKALKILRENLYKIMDNE
ncbi:MAG: RNA polymerase sigma-70 factor [Saprospiraceae bacterium]